MRKEVFIMAFFKTDNKGKAYIDNVPAGAFSGVKSVAGDFKVMALNGTKDCWYNNTFIGDNYAVFKKINGFYQQITKSYSKFGNAINAMVKIEKEQYKKIMAIKKGHEKVV